MSLPDLAPDTKKALRIKTRLVQYDGHWNWEATCRRWGVSFSVIHEEEDAAIFQMAAQLYSRARYHEPASAR